MSVIKHINMWYFLCSPAISSLFPFPHNTNKTSTNLPAPHKKPNQINFRLSAHKTFYNILNPASCYHAGDNTAYVLCRRRRRRRRPYLFLSIQIKTSIGGVRCTAFLFQWPMHFERGGKKEMVMAAACENFLGAGAGR